MAIRKSVLALLLGVMCLQGRSQKIVFTPQFTPQAQFAGYYVAKEKGFYSDEGLDVDICHIGNGAKETPAEFLLDGRADIAGLQLLQSIISRSQGNAIVNVFQLTQHIGLCCVTRKPISSFSELDGLKIGKWTNGYAEICETLEKGGNVHIRWIPAFNPVNLFIYNAIDGVLVYSYNELVQLEQSLGGIDRRNVLVFADQPSIDIPEDGLYVTESFYNSNRDAVGKFVKASKRGWDYAREHHDEALDICWKYISDGHIVTNRQRERFMLEQYLNLQINPATGKPDYAQISESGLERLVSDLAANGTITGNVEYKDFVK